MITLLVIALCLSFGGNIVLGFLLADSEGRHRRLDEPRVLYMPEPSSGYMAPEQETASTVAPPASSPTIEERIAASFPPDAVCPSVPLPMTADTTALRPVVPVIPIKRKAKKRKAKR